MSAGSKLTFADSIRARIGLALLKPFEEKASLAGAAIKYLNLGDPIWTPRRYDQIAVAGYEENVVGFRAVQLVSRAVARLPIILVDGKKKEIDSHPVLDLLKKPNPLQGGRRFRENWTAYLLLSGNSYIEGVGVSDFGGGSPLELYTHRPDRIVINLSELGTPESFVYNYGGVSKEWMVSSIDGAGPMFQLKTFHPTNDVYGLSPIEAARYSIDVHNQSSAWNKSVLQNGARPSGAIVYKPGGSQAGQAMPDGMYKRMKEQIEERMMGPSNASRPLILEGGIEWQQMGLDAVDMEFMEGRKMSAREICWAFGVPSQMLGIPGDNTYANMEEARAGFYEETVIPIGEDILDALNTWLLSTYPDLKSKKAELAVDTDSIEALFPRRKARWEMLSGSRFLSINEKREALKWPKHEDPMADEILVEGSLVPLSEIGVGAIEEELDPEAGVLDPANAIAARAGKPAKLSAAGKMKRIEADRADRDEQEEEE